MESTTNIRFILGYENAEDENLTHYAIEEATRDAEEWCMVDAKNLTEAKANYEKSFEEHKTAGRINGCL